MAMTKCIQYLLAHTVSAARLTMFRHRMVCAPR